MRPILAAFACGCRASAAPAWRELSCILGRPSAAAPCGRGIREREVSVSWLDFVVEQWILVAILTALVVAFLVLESRKGGSTISHHQATRLLNGGQAVLVDLRDSKEFKTGHIVDAINIPYACLATKLDDLEKHKSKQIIVVDKMGQHAGSAGKVLRDKGFQVVRMQGGMMEWTQQNLPLVKA